MLKSIQILFTLSVVLSNYSAGAQVDTIFIDRDFRNHNFPEGLSYFESGAITPDSAKQIFNHYPSMAERLIDDNLGIVSGYFWFSTKLKNSTNQWQHLYFVAEHSHLRRLAFYESKNDSLHLISESGYQFSFRDRLVPHRYFVFPVELAPFEAKQVILLVDHENSLNLPMSLWNQNAYHQLDYKTNLIIGAGLGFVLFCAVFAFIGTALLRLPIFAWYFFYLLSVLLYGFTELGFSAQYLFPSFPDFDGPLSIHTSLYPFIILIKFSQTLLNTKKTLPLPHRVLNFIFYFMITIVLFDLILGEFWRQYAFYFLPVVFGLVLLGMGLLAYCGLKTLKINRPIAILYLSASGMVIFSSMIFIPNAVFGIAISYRFNPVLIGYLFEVFFLSIALIVQYRQLQLERGRLAVKIAEQKQLMYKNYIDGIEKERSRIAGELHDDIGARLSNIKQNVGTQKENAAETRQKIDNLINDLRRLSHDLALPVAHVSGLRPLAEQLVGDIRKNSTVDFRLHFYEFEERFSPAEILQLYRILQEALHNIVSHAHAGTADIQFFGYANETIIVIEDDGIGFEIPEKTNGLGLNQMKIRAESLGGRIEINSKPGMGTHLLIAVPLGKAG